MLIITRKENEAVVIEAGDYLIEVKVTEIGSQVRIGIDAPGACKIWRKELYPTVQANRLALEQAGSLQSIAELFKEATE